MRSTSVPDPIYLPLLTSLWSQWMYYVCFSTSVVLVNLSVLSLIGWLFIFANKCDFDTINLLFVIGITTILVKLLQLIWGVVTTFVVCQSVCLSYVSVYLELQLLGGASKRGGDWGLEKVKIFGCTQIYGGPQDIFWGEPEIRRKLGSLVFLTNMKYWSRKKHIYQKYAFMSLLQYLNFGINENCICI